MDLQEAIKIVQNAKEANQLIDNFVKENFKQKFLIGKKIEGFMFVNDWVLENDKTILVKYEYGMGDISMNNSYKINL